MAQESLKTRMGVQEEKVSNIEGAMGVLGTDVKDIKDNHLHDIRERISGLKGEITIIGGKMDNVAEKVDGLLEGQGNHWPKPLAVLIAVMSSALVGLAMYALTK